MAIKTFFFKVFLKVFVSYNLVIIFSEPINPAESISMMIDPKTGFIIQGTLLQTGDTQVQLEYITDNAIF